MPSIANSRIVNCPQCDEPMVLRKSARGEFWGCSAFPRCRGTRRVGEETKDLPKLKSKYAAIARMDGTHEQEAIWNHLLNGASHAVVNAGPGVGKTWSILQYCLRAPKTVRIQVTCFNKHIEREMAGKVAASGLANVTVRTSHSWGNKVIRATYKSIGEPDENKMTAILEQLYPAPLVGRGEWRRKINLAEKLCSYVKNYLIDYKAGDFRQRMEEIVDRHDVDCNGSFEIALSLVPKALDICKERAGVSIDFDDMIWLPVVLKLPVPNWLQADITFVDESQDLNALQHELLFMMIGTSGRLCIVGDFRQAIYGFRGSSTNSMEDLAARLEKTARGVDRFPMTITQRCPKLHAQMARALYPLCNVCGAPEAGHPADHTFAPSIQALENAPLGSVDGMKQEKALAEMKPGDLVLCRCNAPLISAAYSLIRRGVRPVVKGRDIGKGLIQLLDGLQEAARVIPLENEVERMREALRIYRYEQQQKLMPLGDKAQSRLSALDDRRDCLMEFLDAKTVSEARQRITSLFQLDRREDDEDDSDAVVLGTIHRTKGLESYRVFVLSPDLIPHPAARRDWEHEQERHCAWIAMTRAKFDRAGKADGTVIFCGAVPSIYGPTEPYPAPEPDEPEYEEEVMPTENRQGGKSSDPETVSVTTAGEDINALPTSPAVSVKKLRAKRATHSRKGLERALDTQHTKHDPVQLDDDEPPF